MANAEIIKQLKAENYSSLFELLNLVFAKKNGVPTNFEKDLPKMCGRDDEHMNNHYGIFDNDKLVAVIGVYLIPTVINGENLLFSTVGNIAVHPDYEGKGYMNLLLEKAMQVLNEKGVDASRLGGLRSRYNRFGYETCGTNYNFTLTSYNTKKLFNNYLDNTITFTPINKTDYDVLKFCYNLYKNDKIYTLRGEQNNYINVYNSMVAWQNIPYLATTKNGEKLGYIVVNPSKTVVSEVFGTTTENTIKILCNYQNNLGCDLKFSLPPYSIELLKIFTENCEYLSTSPICHFKVINYQKLTNALLKLKSSYCKMIDGESNILIENYGTIKIKVENGIATCSLTSDTPDIKVTNLQAQRLLFSYLPTYHTINKSPAFLNAILPLPLSWNLQDRV